jgi:hypothetical protein
MKKIKQELIDCQSALEKTVGILVNIRHETDYMPDSYYEWIDKVINEVDEHLPVYEDEPESQPQPPIV